MAGIYDTSETHDSGAVLIIVENWDVHKFLQLLFDDEAIRGFDVFQVDSTETGSKEPDTVDEVLWIISVDANVNRFDACKLVE
jgi:hypothetical protein